MAMAAILDGMIGEAPAPLPDRALATFDDAHELPADQHPAKVYIARLAEGSHSTQRSALEEIARLLSSGRQTAETLAWHRIRYQHAAAVRSVLLERYAPATVNRILAALRGALKEAWLLGLMGAEDFHRAAVVSNVRAERLLAGRALAIGELRRLFSICADDPTPRGRRDAAILALVYGLGLRRAEAVALDVTDYDPPLRVTVRQSKNRRDREVYAGPGAIDALLDWQTVRGHEPGPFLCAIRCDRSGRLFDDRRGMTAQALYYRIKVMGTAAGLKNFSPHDCRRTYVSELLDAGADLRTVQRLVGHASIETTARYDRRGEEAKIRASALLPVPYQAPRKPQEAFQQVAEGVDSGATPVVPVEPKGAQR